jgi:hypothetical protein
MSNHHRKAEPAYGLLVISLGISVVFYAAGAWVNGGVDFSQTTTKLLWPLIRLMAMISVGVMVAQVIENSGWTRWMAAMARPLFRFGRLGDRCGAAFTMAFISGAAANAMLYDYFKNGLISRRQLFFTNFVNQLPAFFLHLPTTFFIVVPMTQWAGGLYFLLTFLAALLRTVIVVVIGHFWCDGHDGNIRDGSCADPQPPAASGGKTDWGALQHRLFARVTGIAVYVIPIYVVVQLLNDLGAFSMIQKWIAKDLVIDFIPVESASVVILSFVAEFTSAFAAAGAMLDAGVLTIKQTVVALLLGNVLAFPVRSLRHQLPRYMGIFSPKLGTELLVMGQLLRVASLLFVGWGYYLLA